MEKDEKDLEQDAASEYFDELTGEQDADEINRDADGNKAYDRESSAYGPSPEDDEAADKIRGICHEILKHFPLQRPPRIRTRQDEETIFVNIEGDGTGILIGKRGQTLEAIQYIINRIAYRQVETKKRIDVDTEHYRARRRGQLVAQARRAAEEVRETGEPVVLDPMSPSERRVIHMTLKDQPDLYTESEGPPGYRRVNIKPASKDDNI